MRKKISIVLVTLILAPVFMLFQNATPNPLINYPPDYNYCIEKMGINYSIFCFYGYGINYEWSNQQQIVVDGFNEHMMEPKLSNDQKVLFFNDKPASGDLNMKLHYAVLQPNGHYQYVGILPGTSSNSLDGVPAIDKDNKFYFTSVRNWVQTTNSIYGGQLILTPTGLAVANPISVDRFLPRKAVGEIDMDIDISYSGKTAISSRAVFSNNKPYPDSSKLLGFEMTNFVMTSDPLLNIKLNYVNRSDWVVYAPNLSIDQMELYFTFFKKGITPSGNDFVVAVSKRQSLDQMFGQPQLIAAIKGSITEAPSLTVNDGQKTLIFHKIDPVSNKFRIYKVTRN